MNVDITPKYVYLGNIAPGQVKTATISVCFTGDLPLEILDVSCEKKRVNVIHNLLSEESARTFKYGITSDKELAYLVPNTHVLQITYEARTEDLGEKGIDTVVIHTNIKGSEKISVPIFANVVDPVRLYPSILFFTGVKPDEITSKAIEVVSLDGNPFKIISVKAKSVEIDYNTTPGFTTRKSLSLSAKGETLLNLSDTSLDIEVEVRNQLFKKQSLKLPIHVQ
jgi:hypothetical protein